MHFTGETLTFVLICFRFQARKEECMLFTFTKRNTLQWDRFTMQTSNRRSILVLIQTFFLMIRCQLILDLSFKGVQSIWCWFPAVHPHLSIHWKWTLTDITLYWKALFPCNTSTHTALDSGVRWLCTAPVHASYTRTHTSGVYAHCIYIVIHC